MSILAQQRFSYLLRPRVSALQLYGARNGSIPLPIHERHVYPGGLAGIDGEQYKYYREMATYAFSGMIWNYPKGYAPYVTSVIIRGCLAEDIPSASPPSVSSMEPETVAQLFCSTSDMYTLGGWLGSTANSTSITGRWQPYTFPGMPSYGIILRDMLHM